MDGGAVRKRSRVDAIGEEDYEIFEDPSKKRRPDYNHLMMWKQISYNIRSSKSVFETTIVSKFYGTFSWRKRRSLPPITLTIALSITRKINHASP
jgi:hypothetical protein